ncbi:PKD domain-containing protein, partial [Flavobacterium cerinum]
MLKKRYLIIILLTSLSLFSQKEAANWYFGNKAGLDFNSGSPVPLLNGQMDQLEGCASISSSTGQLRIYTDGISVYNFNHQIILNGTGLMGDPSSTQSAIIIPAPGNPDIYYIFTTPKEAGANGLRYTQVDMSLNGGNGAVTALKNIALDPGFLTAEKLTAVKHSDNEKIWVVAHRMGNNQYVSYLIDNNGVNTTPIISSVGKIHTIDLGAGAIGYLKSSSNGKKIACGVLLGTNTGLELFDFNNTSGALSNAMTLNIYSVYGVEFSGDNKKLYYSSDFYGVIYQYDLTAGNLAAIKQSVKQITSENKYGGLQLALDGKIYAAKRFENHLGVINNPNEIGAASNFVGNGVNLGGKTSECGLPPFIQGYFLQDIKAEQFCTGSPTLFSITMSAAIVSANWNFGDGTTSNEINPGHIYQTGGTYNVTVSFTTNAGPDIINLSKQILIIASPIANQPNDIKICISDNDPATFNLVLQTPAVLGNQIPTVLIVTYYASQTDLANGNAITSITHTLSFQTIIAKITNTATGCFKTVEFKTMRIIKPKVLGKVDMTICNQNGTTGTFDLTQNTALILGSQDPVKFGVNYYTTVALANNGTPGTEITLPQTYSSVNAIIYARVYNLLYPECYEIASFSLKVLRSPVLNPDGNPFRYVMCPDVENTTTATINTIDFIKNLLSNSQFLNIPLLELNAVPIQDTDLSHYSITYYKLLSDAQNDTARLTNGYIATDGETIYVRVKHNLATDCFSIGQIVLWIKTPQINTPTPLFACSDGISPNTGVFKLSQKNGEITQNQTGNSVKYYETLQAAKIGGNNTISDSAYTGNNLQIVYARVENAQTGCFTITPVVLEVIPAPIASVPAPLEICDTNNDGFGVYNLDPVIQAIQASLGNVVVTVHETP